MAKSGPKIALFLFSQVWLVSGFAAQVIGSLDIAGNTSGGSTVVQGSTLLVAGWAADTQTGSPVQSVTVFVDAANVGTATLGIARPDVASYFNRADFTNSGWSFQMSASGLSFGQHTVTVTAVGASGTLALGPKTFTVTGQILGSLDIAGNTTNGGTTVLPDGTLWVAGWAADTRTGSPVQSVTVFVDGANVGTATLGIARSDVAAYFNRQDFMNSGWSFQTPASAFALGQHNATVTAVGTSGTVQFGPRTFNIATAQPPSLVSVTPTGSTGSQQTFTFVSSDANGGADISSLQVLFANASGGNSNACYFLIDRQSSGILLWDDVSSNWGQQSVTAGGGGTLSNPQCSLSAAGSSIRVSGVNLTVNLAVTFYPAYAGPHNITMEAVDWTGLDVGPATMGTWTVPAPTPSISGVSPTSGPTGTAVTITGTNFGATQGTSTVTFNGTPASITSWADTQIIAVVPTDAATGNILVAVLGVPSNGMAFQVTGPPVCRIGNLTGSPAAPGNPISVSIGAPRATSVYFAVTGATTNPYSAQVTASQVPNSTTWSASIATGSLLGEYMVVPVISNAFGTVTCTQNTNVFNVRTSTPANPGQASCASMTGTWTDVAPGYGNLTWSLVQSGASGQAHISGSATGTGSCGNQITYSVTNASTYNPPTYNLYAENGTPPTSSCNGTTYTTLNQYTGGSLPSNGSCGVGTGTFTAHDPVTGELVYHGSNTLTAAERIPDGETSAFSAWADQYGAVTTGIFNVVLTSSAGYNFGGRRVTQVDPTAQETPAGMVGSDSCYWTGAPWRAPFTSLGDPGRSGTSKTITKTAVMALIMLAWLAIHSLGFS